MSQMSCGLSKEERAGGTRTVAGAASEFLTDKQLASLLHVTTRTTMRWRADGGGPPFVRVGEWRVLYSRGAVDVWLQQRTFATRAAESVAA